MNVKPIEIFIKNNHRFKNKNAIEIGGPSKIFEDKGKIFPVYAELNSLDNCNYKESNFWSKIKEGEKIRFNKRKEFGKQIVSDGSDLSKVQDASYELLLNSHVIEHLANPIKALHEWERVLKTNGILVMIVPHKDNTYDNKRPVTKFEHLVSDYEKNIREDDSTHFQEVIELHDLIKDTTVSGFTDHFERTHDNFNTRIVHHHVFDIELVVKLVDFIGFKILGVQPVKPYHIFVIAEKTGGINHADNTYFLNRNAEIYTRSPFITDQNLI
jgi:SAM-dependent methyltransferase